MNVYNNSVKSLYLPYEENLTFVQIVHVIIHMINLEVT